MRKQMVVLVLIAVTSITVPLQGFAFQTTRQNPSSASGALFPVQQVDPERTTAVISKAVMFRQAVRRLESHLHITVDGQFYLDVSSAGQVGVDPEIFSSIAAGMRDINARLRAKSLTLGDIRFGFPDLPFPKSGTTPLPSVGRKTANTNSFHAAAVAGGGGSTGIEYHWWGVVICISHQDMEAVAAAGGIEAILLAFIPEAGPYLAAVAGIDVAILMLCDWYGDDNGVWIAITPIGWFCGWQ